MNTRLSVGCLARTAVLIFLILLSAGCGVVLQSVEKDKELGRETARQVETDMGIYHNAGGLQYLKRVGERLVRANLDQTFDYRFAVVDQYEPNAFALPGGYICVSRGLLAFGITGEGNDPRQAAEQLKKVLSREYRAEPTESKSVKIAVSQPYSGTRNQSSK
jgi:hypothetical protein